MAIRDAREASRHLCFSLRTTVISRAGRKAEHQGQQKVVTWGSWKFQETKLGVCGQESHEDSLVKRPGAETDPAFTALRGAGSKQTLQATSGVCRSVTKNKGQMESK